MQRMAAIRSRTYLGIVFRLQYNAAQHSQFLTQSRIAMFAILSGTKRTRASFPGAVPRRRGARRARQFQDAGAGRAPGPARIRWGGVPCIAVLCPAIALQYVLRVLQRHALQ